MAFAAAVALCPSRGAAADKAALACIQAAEHGQTARNGGALLRARELFARCAAHDCPTVLRRDCSSWLEDNDRQIPSIVPGAHDAQGHDIVEARVSVDGVVVREHLDGNPVEVDPGAHVVRFETVGAAPVEVRAVVRAGEKSRTILATLAPPATKATGAPAASAPTPPVPVPAVPAPEPGGHVPVGAWMLGGLGVAAIGVFAYFGARGEGDASGLRSSCAPGCTSSQVKDVRTELITADVALGVGGLALAAALWIGVRGLMSPTAASAWNLVVAPSPGVTRLGLILHF